ncbi:ribosome alternative rescue factor ArfA [Vibrio makurazakiensis]
MSKKKRDLRLTASENQPALVQLEHDIQRGKIQDNALKAVVTSQLFKTRVVKAKKGKGSFERKAKHRGKEPYSKAA